VFPIGAPGPSPPAESRPVASWGGAVLPRASETQLTAGSPTPLVRPLRGVRTAALGRTKSLEVWVEAVVRGRDRERDRLPT